MLHLSPQVGELLLKATHSQDLDEALHKVLRDYLDRKLSSLSAAISRLETKWGCSFAKFQEKTKGEYTYVEAERKRAARLGGGAPARRAEFDDLLVCHTPRGPERHRGQQSQRLCLHQ